MKQLPYYKFDVAEWINGAITLESLEAQGVFINICAYYWFKSGCLTLTEIKRRVKCRSYVFDALVQSNLIKVTGDDISITFLDEQLTERGKVSTINSLNGSKGGAPKGNNNAKKTHIDKQETTEKQPKTSNIEENRTEEEKKREEQNRTDSAFAEVLVWPSFLDFWDKYDKKQDKPKCEKLWKKITQGAREKIMQNLEIYIPTTPDKQYRKNPLTYLNSQSWENEIIIPNNNGTKLTDKRQQQTGSLIEGFAKRHFDGDDGR